MGRMPECRVAHGDGMDAGGTTPWMEEVGPRLEQRPRATQEQLPDARERPLPILRSLLWERALCAKLLAVLFADRVFRLTCVSHLPFVPVSSRSEEHTSALQSLMRISYAVFCL